MKFLSDKKNLYFTGMYLSLFAFMICSAAGEREEVILFKISAVLLIGLFLFVGNNANGKADFEKSVIVLAVGLFNILMLQRGKMQGYSEVFNIICSVVLIIMGITYFVFYHKGISVKKWFSENKLILLVITCFVLLSIEVIDSWSMWDSWAYHISLISMMKNLNADFSGMYGLRLCSHNSYGYSLWLAFFQLLKEGTALVQIADIALAGISIYAYYQILRKILGKRYSNKILALAAMPYAFSPFVMGIVGNLNLDSATMYFAMIFIACSLYHYECLELIFAFCFCSTKESAVLYYVVYIVAKVVCEYLCKNRFQLWNLIKFGFGDIKNYMYALPTILLMALAKLTPDSGWGSVKEAGWDNTGYNCLGISQNVISMKLKQTFLLNFNWIFWIIIFLGIIILLIQKMRQKTKADKKVLEKTIPIIMTGIIIIVFGCLYITWTHARYIAPMIPLMYLTATIIVATIKWKEFAFCGLNIILAVILLIQCFNTIDPLTKNTFHEIPIGSESIYSMQLEGNERISDSKEFHDAIIYNRQYIYWQETLVKLLNEAGYDGNMLVVAPNDVYCTKYELLGTGIYKTDKVLWNIPEGRFEYSNRDAFTLKQCVEIEYCHTTEMENTWESTDFDKVLYMIPAWSNIDDSITSDNERFSKEVVKEGEIKNKGYNIQYKVIDMKYKYPLISGNYTVSPKQDSTLGLGTDGRYISLKETGDELGVTLKKSKYQIMFNTYQVSMDVQYNKVDENGTVWAYTDNGSDAQRWILEKREDYYMICWGDYALTYDLSNNSVRLTPKTGNDNQLWSFTQ